MKGRLVLLLLAALPGAFLLVLGFTRGSATAAFLEADGQVVIEAENHAENVGRGGKSWTLGTSVGGFSGAGYLASLPNSGTQIDTGYATTSPELRYEVKFATTGTYYVWLRGHADGTADNAVHVGLDGQPQATADRMSLPQFNVWAWFKSTMDGPVATLSVTTAGVHTVNVWMREDGLRLDRVLLTTSSSFVPTGLGPAESAQDTGAPGTGPLGTWVAKSAVPSVRAEVGVAALNGKVYVLGGKSDAAGFLSTVSVYDPSGNSWTAAAPLPGPARDHLGAAAVGGKLYAIGGLTGWPGPSVANVYAYDPATNTWTQKASLPRPRGAMGVAVVNGKIYTAGGLNGGAAVNDVSVYDPATDSWTTLAPLPTARHHLTAEAIGDNVYAIGGRTGELTGPLATNEVYDTTTGAWSAAAPMPTARSGHGSGVLNGRIYAFGGEGSGSGTGIFNANEEYDPATNRWRSVAPMLTPRHGTDGAVIGKTIYAPGGGTSQGKHDSAANEAFTLDLLGSWSTLPALPNGEQRREGGVVVVGGHLYVIGGNKGSETRTSSVLRYDLATRTWAPTGTVASFPGPGLDHVGAVVLGGNIYLIGGWIANPTPDTATLYAYDPGTNTWAQKASMPKARGAVGAAVHGGKIYVVGGKANGERVGELTVYDPMTNSWTTKAPMPTARDHVQLVALGGRLYAFGGFIGVYPSGVTAKVEVYDPSTDSWSTAASMPTARADFGVGVVNGRAVLFGGINGGGVTGVNEEYDPVTDSWRTLTTMPAPPRRATVGTAADGIVYAPGGSATDNDPSLARFESFAYASAEPPPPGPPPPDTTPPTVVSTSPDAGATGVAASANVAATFSEAMGASTVTASTFTLVKQGAPSPVAATVSYNAASKTATLNPDANLDAGASYTATVKGGSGGAKDVAGNALASDKMWSFTVASAPPPSGSVVYRVNAGGPSLTGSPAWSADTAAAPSPYVNAAATGNTPFSTTTPINMTHASVPAGTPAALFQAERWDGPTAPELQWDFPVTAGTYEVRLYLAEIYTGAQAAGARVFDVSIEGQLVLDNLDVFAEVGGFKGLVKSFTVTSDANLDIDFGHVVENPSVKGIEILTAAATPNQLGAAPANLAFGSVALNQTQTQQLQLTNLGAAGAPAIVVDATSIAGADSAHFSDSFDDAGNVTLAPGTSTTLNVSFKPTSTGAKSATLNVVHSGANSPLAIPLSGSGASTLPVGFGKSVLPGTNSPQATSLQFGPDGRLYVAQQNGFIKAYTIVRNGPNNYAVTATETISAIRSIQNHNDNGSLNLAVNDRIITGILVVGTSANPVVYATSSDPRIGGGSSGTDLGLDTNSSALSRLTWTGSSWQKVDLVRGLPRSEENHSANGMQLDPGTNTLYVAQGGNTNMGATSNNFALLPEFALSGAILAVNLSAIGNTTYDLPTLTDAGVDANDPFGGDDGKNQAKLVPGGPVQIHAPGFRNPYDLVITNSGRMYTIDNGGNAGWGDTPVGEGPSGNCTNGVKEPGTTQADTLHLITGAGYYGGHPNPTRANTSNTFNGQSPVLSGNPVECDFRAPGLEQGNLTSFSASTNGLDEYTASNFGGALKGDLVTASFNNAIYRIDLNAAGTSANASVLFANVGSIPLDVTAQGDAGPFPGTIWSADVGNGSISVFEPNDFVNAPPPPQCTGQNSSTLDEDGDGFKNADEIANGTDPCSAADVPPDRDGDKISNLNDPDDDNDGQPDTSDPFAIDAQNGTTKTLPVRYTWDNDAPNAGGLANLGFTGLMTNGTADYEDLFDPADMTAGGAAGVTTIDNVTEGDALGSANTQEYGFQFGVKPPQTGTFTAHTRILSPFAGLTPQGSQSMGLFLGTGNQDNYVKLVVSANGGAGGVQFLKEVGGTVTSRPQAAVALPGPSAIDLYLTVDPVAQTVLPSYSVGTTGTRVNLGSAEPIPAGWLASTTALAVGIISTSAGPAPEFPATWDLIEIEADAPTDTTPPTITQTAPSAGASAAAASVNVEATFSEAMNAASITTGTFTLQKQGAAGVVPAAVSYDASAKKAILNPSADLEAGVTYTATVKGGASGVKDVAGNPLAADTLWSFTVAASAPPAQHGLKGDYFNNQDFTALVLSRLDPTINFNWGSGSPHSSIGADTFSVRWTGEVKADHSQTYTFSTFSDDGVRLWVGGQLVINNWTTHPPTTNTGTIALQAGQWYPVTLEYFEAGGGATISLSYASPSTPKQIVPADHLRPPAGGTDTTAPVIVDTAPRGGGTGTTLAVRPSVVFSEPVDSATLTTSTLTLRKAGAADPVLALVNYDAPNRVATLTPAAALDASASYSATVKGGPDGVKDLAGNALSADVVWGFSTGSGTVTTSLVAGAGDIACDPANPSFAGGFGTATECRQLATSDLLVQADYDRVLMLGDAQYENGTFTAFQQSYDLSWGRVKSITSPVVGNHEYQTPGAAGYFQYFGSAAGDPARGYYSFDLGPWHLVALNTNCAQVDCATGSPQERWLRADLAAHPAQCTLALSHHPRYSSGVHGDNPVIGPLYAALYEAGADVLLSGHDHNYERLAPSDPSDQVDTARGIRQFVVGTGGAHLRPFATIDSDSEIRSSTAFGVLELSLRDGAYDWRFVPEAGQTFADSGSGACH